MYNIVQLPVKVNKERFNKFCAKMQRKWHVNTIYTSCREEWHLWLSENFQTENGIWFIFPMKASGEPAMLYNDAVEKPCASAAR